MHEQQAPFDGTSLVLSVSSLEKNFSLVFNLVRPIISICATITTTGGTHEICVVVEMQGVTRFTIFRIFFISCLFFSVSKVIPTNYLRLRGYRWKFRDMCILAEMRGVTGSWLGKECCALKTASSNAARAGLVLPHLARPLFPPWAPGHTKETSLACPSNTTSTGVGPSQYLSSRSAVLEKFRAAPPMWAGQQQRASVGAYLRA